MLSECQSDENLGKTASKKVAESKYKLGLNNTIEDSQKLTENSLKNNSFMTGGLSGLAGQSSTDSRSLLNKIPKYNKILQIICSSAEEKFYRRRWWPHICISTHQIFYIWSTAPLQS